MSGRSVRERVKRRGVWSISLPRRNARGSILFLSFRTSAHRGRDVEDGEATDLAQVLHRFARIGGRTRQGLMRGYKSSNAEIAALIPHACCPGSHLTGKVRARLQGMSCGKPARHSTFKQTAGHKARPSDDASRSWAEQSGFCLQTSSAPAVAFRGVWAQKPMPPPPGMAGAAASFFGSSATSASVVMSRPATEAAS